jgi:hypothetical protein
VPGPSPKPAALRARTNSTSEEIVLVADPDREVPELPAIRGWQDTTRDFWATLWTSPMAQMYVAADTPGLLRLTITMDDYLRAETPEERRALSSEIRQLEKQFGLSPESRTKLRWMISEAESARRRATSPTAATPPPPVSADRSILFES